MLFSNVLTTLVLIGLFVVVPAMVINLSRRQLSKLVEHFRDGHHRP